MSDQKIDIFTDGSCKGNPGPGGWAAIILNHGSEKPLKILRGHESATTNNRMEMTAVIEGLKFISENNFQNHIVTLYSDSNLIIQTLNQGWKRKANQDLWQEIDGFNEELSVKFVWVRGHHKNKWNNECDKVAVAESAKAQKNNRGKTNLIKNFSPNPQQKLF